MEDLRDEQIAGTSREVSDLAEGTRELGPELPRTRLDSKFSIDLSDMRSIECGLASNGEVFFASHCNDFSLRSQDASWGEALFPNCVHFLERGGRFGSLHRQEMCKVNARFVDKPSS
jgi:hypothetical protein